MCALCRQTPCDPRCPNAEEPKPAKICTQCGDGIPSGEWYYDSPQGPICYGCIDDMSAQEILTILGEGMKIA